MNKIAVLDNKGESKEGIVVPKEIAEAKTNDNLLSEAIRVLLANARQATKKTKTRGEVRGGGKKPWRQKGTGRARTGSIRNPIWRGGGTIFGPTGEKNYKINLPKKKKRLANILALKAKIDANEVVVIKDLSLKEIKTKTLAEIIKKICGDAKTLLVIAKSDELTQKSARNLPNVLVDTADNLNAFLILNNQKICFTKEAFEKLVSKFPPKADQPVADISSQK